jgi:hypothetical protein
MALSGTVTKKSVTKSLDKLYHITVNFSLKDGTTEVLNRDYSIEYRTGDTVSSKQTELLRQIQSDVDNYKAEQAIFAASQFTTVVTNLNNGIAY